MFKFKETFNARNKELKTRAISKHYFSPFLHVGIRTRYMPKGLNVDTGITAMVPTSSAVSELFT